jgi:acetyltransferase
MPISINSWFRPSSRCTRADDCIELTDGRRVHLSPATAQDEAAERAFVSALSLTSRYRRFHFGLRELTPEASRAMVDVDQQRHVAIVVRPEGEATIVADARYVRRDDGAEAEFAVVVADEWQGAGLGRALLTRLATHARTRGVRRLFGDVLWGNASMLALMRSLGAELRRHPGDSTLVRAEFVVGDSAHAGTAIIRG